MESQLKKNEKILELKLRNKIYLFVKKFPGSHIRELERKTQIPYSTLKYHLHYLAKHNLLLEKTGSGNIQFYPKSIELEDIEILSLLKQKNIRKILLYLVSYNYCTKSELEDFTKLAASTIIWYTNNLIKKEVITKSQKDNKTFFQLKFDKEKIIKVLITYKESLFDEIVNRTIEMWEMD